MKILAFSDIHGNESLLDAIVKTAKRENVDFLVCAGDLCDWGMGLEKLILKLRSSGKPLIMVPGNHEDIREFEAISKKYGDFLININKRAYYIGKYCFFGYGEGVWETIDKDFMVLVNKFEKKHRNYKKLVIITHAPAFGTKLDKMPVVGHVGNKSFRKAINKIKPDLFISGHLDETAGEIDKVGKTLLMNPGSVGRVIEI